MTHDQAIAVRTLHLCGIPQIGWVLNEAIAVIKNTRTETPRKKYGEEEPQDSPRDRLHAAIMNLPHSRMPTYENSGERLAYKDGHRDARHAAAELVIGGAQS